MAENINPHAHHRPGVGHETTDVNIWAIGKFGIALVIMTLLSVGLLIGVFRFFNTRDARGEKAVGSAAERAKRGGTGRRSPS